MVEQDKQKLEQLARQLLNHTQANTISWKVEVPNVAFSLSLAASSLNIVSVDGDGLRPIKIDLMNSEGVTVLSARSDEFHDADDLGDLLWTLFSAVQGKTSPAGELLDSMLRDLDTKDIPF